MKKRLLKKIVVKKYLSMCFGVIFLFSIFPSVSFAANTYKNNARLMAGVGDYGKSTKYYWINSSGATTSWINNADKAVSKWTQSNGTGAYTPISFRKTSDKKNSIADAYYQNYGNRGWFGLVEYFIGDTMIVNSGSTPTKNYKWAKIKMNTYKYYSNKSLYHSGKWNNKVIGEVSEQIFSHEFGHVLGLAHMTSTSANAGKVLMRGAFPRAIGPTKDELNTITKLYK